MSRFSNKIALYNLLIARSYRILIFKELKSYLNFQTNKKQLCDGISTIRLNCYEAIFNDQDIEKTLSHVEQYQIEEKSLNLLNCEFTEWIDFIGQQLLDDVENIQELDETEFRLELDEMMVYFKDKFNDS